MTLPNPGASEHRAWLFRLLTHLVDDPTLSQSIMFKGGTCAVMRGLLDRFSMDLDFDRDPSSDKRALRKRILAICTTLELTIKRKSSQELFYVLQYPSHAPSRNTLKISIATNTVSANIYDVVYLSDIDRYVRCQSPETMFANKLVSLTDRFFKYETIAGRDVYDIHAFFMCGLSYDENVIVERTKLPLSTFFQNTRKFVAEHIDDTVIRQDLNYILQPSSFEAIRKTLKQEVLVFLDQEIQRQKK